MGSLVGYACVEEGEKQGRDAKVRRDGGTDGGKATFKQTGTQADRQQTQ